MSYPWGANPRLAGKRGPTRPDLRGRAAETQMLGEVLAGARSGCAQAVVLRGEPGVGKTALLAHLVSEADDCTITRVSGVESDMELAYAGLHQLCSPLLEHLPDLPEPQRAALTVAFGRGTGAAPDRFLVGLALLTLLAAAAAGAPVLCVVDDAQWLDQVTIQTLAFVARRLVAEPVALVFAARDEGAEPLRGLAELHVDGLSDADARHLLDDVIVGPVDAAVRDRLIAETRGNPLALLELPRILTAAELAAGFGQSGTPHLAGRIEQSYLRRIRNLPSQTQRLLVAAAAEPVGDAAVLIRAAAGLGIPIDMLAPAESAGVIELGPRVRFRHPLVRSAAYRGADLSARRTVHRALADATDPETDPDRRAWHLASAASGPDDAVAALLEESADRAQARGGVAAAAAFLERAAALTADPGRRASRALAAAQAKRDAAAPAEAHELLAVAELRRLPALQQAQAARLHAQMQFVRRRGGDTSALPLADTADRLLVTAAQFEGLDDYIARETYLEALAAAMFAGRLGNEGAVADIAAAAQAAHRRMPASPLSVAALMSVMTQRITEGSAPLAQALALMSTLADGRDRQLSRWMVPGFPVLQETAAYELWDDAIVARLASAVMRRARDTGALAMLPETLAYRAGAHLLAGEFTEATILLDEARAITESTKYYAPIRYQTVLLAAWRADDSARAVIDAAAADGDARGEGRVLGLTSYATAVLHNGAARYEEALAAAEAACDYEDLGLYGWSLTELIEAAVYTGDLARAQWALTQLEQRTAHSETGWARGTVAGARALVTGDDVLFRDGIKHLGRARVGVHLARAHLRYGEWLRRAHRRNDARHHLTLAHDMFSRFGAQGFRERARRELIPAGQKLQKQPVVAGEHLTAQEAQIARLAGTGLTNQEIAAQLFISAHTVDWHLRKVFVKLGVTSRRELRTLSWAG
ncbi:LuxR family transcriptional regulator [Mycobacterium sp. djl-10]|nr:LuxR family transcriptional regulator [Mycobacterium sp. djl-10]